MIYKPLLLFATGILLMFSISSCSINFDVEPFIPKSKIVWVDLDGYKLYTKIQGNSGSSIVFLSGLGDELGTWSKIQNELGRNYRTLSYDRAGVGLSTQAGHQSTGSDLALELKKVLEKSEFEPPYLLVGHSIGGLYARIFAGKYPHLVSGMVLIDYTLEDKILALKEVDLGGMKPEQLLEQIALEMGLEDGSKREFIASLKTAEQVKASNFPLEPVTVITALKPSPEETPEDVQMKSLLHAQYAKSIPKSKHVQVQSSHHIHLDQPDLIIAEIKARILNN
ncbi:alpha/beta fold hydrolase [Aquiflexum gelatinilyticum]|uniref:Alpha/beta hydrolase n=1 Tax=Aquiflexum gelatinilyticum TaxID=2961943 RepID=A0A9X2SYX1_9BACT|nr:alpha/beta hydrolase [Aquiflexum gelatinilyticum]MCR9015709.1 alpha/beta hydrolase [Aquiflexum gelatinilyticum]